MPYACHNQYADAHDHLLTCSVEFVSCRRPSNHPAHDVQSDHYLKRGDAISCCAHHAGPKGTPRKRVDAVKRLLVLRPPRILVCHLKRLRPNRKSALHVRCPEVLDLSPYCWRKEDAVGGAQGAVLYLLYGMVEHQGGAHGGHYVAYTRGSGGWSLISDTDVRDVSVEQVLGAQAYMLFYARIDGGSGGGGGGGVGL